VRTLSRTPIAEVRELTYKKRDAWWTVLLVDPVAAHLVRWLQPYRWVTPNRVSAFAFLLGIGAAACFLTADYPWMVLGALLFHLAFVADCMDGKVGRLNGTGSFFGAWLDYMLDRIRVVLCAIALFGAQWRETGNDWFLVVGGAVVFLDTLHHVNSLEIARVKATMRTRLAEVQQRIAALEPPVVAVTEADPVAGPVAEPVAVADPKPDFRTSFKPYVVTRNALLRSRIRPNVVSTVELHMAVFIIGPITTLILGVSIVTGVLLILFDAAMSASLYLTARSMTRRIAAATRKAEKLQAAQPNALRPVNR
jgi:phosphatidylglycerophosphate synthase